MAAIGNIDKVIDDFNENELEDKINYYQVLENTKEPKVEETTTTDRLYSIDTSNNTTISTLNTSITYYNTEDEPYYTIKEQDQVRRIKFKANSLLEQLNLPLLEEDKDIELKCFIIGRNCDKYCHAVDEDYE